jgi:tetratricopeptide (TPR) repeat protein
MYMGALPRALTYISEGSSPLGNRTGAERDTGPMAEVGDPGVDFFVSYTGSDQGWAEWIGWTLEDAGYRVLLQAWDFGAGAHFVREMHEATRATRTLALLSKAYQSSAFATEEWQAAWADDPDGRQRKLLIARVEDFTREGLLRQIVSVDLFGVNRDVARTRLVAAARGERLKPENEPPFPRVAEPTFPRWPRRWSVPWPRNPTFTGRDAELSDLHAQLTDGATAALLPQALHGLGGVGKTQLAVEYAYRHATDYDLVWWVPAEERAGAVAELARLAEALGLATPGVAEVSAEAAVTALRCGAAGRWLVVADNADAPTPLWGLAGAAGSGGHLLVTSRNPGWGQLAQTIEVAVLPHQEAIDLLRRRAPRMTEAEADEVAKVLGDLPLAVEQAGTWLAGSGISVVDYLQAVRDRVREVLELGRPPAYPVPVAATWTAAMDALDDPAAVLLLQLWAALGPEPVPIDLAGPDTAGAVPPGCPVEWAGLWARLAGDPLARSRAVARVVELGLVRLAEDEVVMHRLVASVLRDHMPPVEAEAMRGMARSVLRAAAPRSTLPASWPAWARLHPHVVETAPSTPAEPAARLVLMTCVYLGDFGNYAAELELARDTHQRWRDAAGDDHTDVLTAALLVARALRSQGDYQAARRINEDVLDRRRSTVGNDHPDTVAAAASLANTLQSQGDHRTARTIQEDILERHRAAFGNDHPDTLAAAGNLASTLRLQGDHRAARTIEEDVLERRRAALGHDHYDTLAAAAHLASTLHSQGDHRAARTIKEDVLDQCRATLGEGHPDTLAAANNLAYTLWSLGEHDAAVSLMTDTVGQARRVLGDDHPHTTASAKTLASWTEG